MAGQRGPDYAHELTEAEQRTLDALLARVGRPAKPVRLRRRLAPLAAAASVILAVGTTVALENLPGHDPAPVTTELPSVTSAENGSVMLERLAAAVGRTAEDPGDGTVRYRKDQRVVIIRAGGGCTVTTVGAEVWAGDTGGRLVATLTTPPAQVTGCEPVGPARTLYGAAAAVPRTTWSGLAKAVAGMPGYLDPRWVSTSFNHEGPLVDLPTDLIELGPRVDKLCLNFADSHCPEMRWTVLVAVMSSPEVTQEVRSAVLQLASTTGDARIMAAPTVDLVGGGVTLLVPFLSLPGDRLTDDGRPTTAELTFDSDSGRLRQLLVRSADGGRTEITVFRERRLTASTHG